MRSTAKAIVVLLAIAAMNAAIVTTAQAVEGPYYEDNEERLEEGQTQELTESAKTSLKLEAKTGQVITCTKAKLAAGATFNGSSGENPGTNKETIEYTGCTVTGNGTPCKVEGEKVTTTALKSTLGYAHENREGPVLEILEPATAKTTTIAEPTFGGEGCKVKSTKISGTVIGEAAGPWEESKEKELKFTKTEKTIWTEASGKLASAKGSMEAFGSTATEETTDEMDSKQAVAILLQGSPTSLCNTVLTEFITKCNAGTYYPEGEKFKAKSISNFEISGGGSTILCTESEFKITELGKNPSVIGSISLKVAEPTFSNCKLNGVTVCTLTSPAAGVEAPPWKGSVLWTKSTTTGSNGFITTKPYSIKAKCGAEECSYIGANFGNSLAASFYNANDINKPEPLSPRAQLQFKKDKMKASGICVGEVEASGIYGVIPTEEMKNVYLAST